MFKIQLDRLKRTKQNLLHGPSIRAKSHLIFSDLEKKRQLRKKGQSMKL